MLTGRLPLDVCFGADSSPSTDPLQLVHAILTTIPPTPQSLKPSVPQVLSNMIMKCLEKNPDARYQSAFGLSVDLRSCAQVSQALSAPLSGSLNFPTFPLGVWDSAAVYAVSKKLYGRETAVATLHQALDQMLSRGTTHVVAIRGSPGSGQLHKHTCVVLSVIVSNASHVFSSFVSYCGKANPH